MTNGGIGTVEFRAGTRCQADGQDWLVEQYEHPRVVLRSLADGVEYQTDLTALRQLPDFVPFGESGVAPAPSPPSFDEDLPDDVWAKATEERARLLETYTGYRSGLPEQETEPPRPEYDPGSYDLTARKAHAHAEYGKGWAPRNIERKWRAFRTAGLVGLVNRSAIRQLSRGNRFEPELEELLLALLKDLVDASNMTRLEIYRQLGLEVKAANLERAIQKLEPIELCSYRTFCRKFPNYGRSRGFTGVSAKKRRSIANEPEDIWRTFEAVRPGQYVLIDVSDFDVFAVDDITKRWIALCLVLAVDLFSHEVVGFRLVPRDARGVDASLLLYDVLEGPPEPHDAGVLLADRLLDRVRQIVGRPGERAYVGVPEAIIVAGSGWEFIDRRRTLVSVPAENVVVDRGKIFLSYAFIDGCRYYGISIQLCRPRRPTDKPQVESIFSRIHEFLDGLPGYKGHDVFSRGKNPTGEAFLTVRQVEAALNRYFANAYRKMPIRGLHLPGRESEHLSPRMMLERGFAIWGEMRLPQRSVDRLRLLPVWWRKRINGYGFDVDGGRYSCPDPILRDLRGRRSGYNVRPEIAGYWPIHRHPADITRAYFFPYPDKDECLELRLNGVADHVMLGDRTWREIKRRWDEYGGNPRDVDLRIAYLNQVYEESGIERRSKWDDQREQRERVDRFNLERDAVFLPGYGEDDPEDGQFAPPVFDVILDDLDDVEEAVFVTSLDELIRRHESSA